MFFASVMTSLMGTGENSRHGRRLSASSRTSFPPVFRKTRIFLILILAWGISDSIHAQVISFPYVENFDSVVPPALPSGWLTTTNRLPAGDFATATTSPRSASNAVLSTNGTISQSLTSPPVNFTNRTPDKLTFYTLRSSTHTAGLVVELSTDNGATFPVMIGDTIRNTGSASYILSTLQLPATLTNQSSVRIRWRIVGASTDGSAGTFRIDDVSITVLTSFDVGVTQLTFSPSTPSFRDNINLQARVKNLGLSAAANYAVDFFRDANDNSVAEASERFASATGTALAPSDSTLITANHPPLGSGDHRFLAVVSFAQDENHSNDTAQVVAYIESLETRISGRRLEKIKSCSSSIFGQIVYN